MQAKGNPLENYPHNAVCSNISPLPTLQQAQPHAACSNIYCNLLESSSLISFSVTLRAYCSFPTLAEKLLKRISSMGQYTTRFTSSNVLYNDLFQSVSEARNAFRGTALTGRGSRWRTIPELKSFARNGKNILTRESHLSLTCTGLVLQNSILSTHFSCVTPALQENTL